MPQRRSQARFPNVNKVDDNLTGRTVNISLVGGASNDIIYRTSNTNALALTDIPTTKGNSVITNFSANNKGAFEIDTIALGMSNPNNAGSSRATSQVSILAMGQGSVQLSGQASLQSNGQTSIGNASVALSFF
ncbi:hypothetical protein HRE53_25425 [Acaryochloris sp. 'Moss Beach']|uniref:hypothetical protein n=1 Tax=Acaryochloris sp. 'Moss Beach' TaxID=2740837 RepID=UPI001F333EE1|nr:hypothetical protein [Acaryochloris sp. 'Moss Beach']UJB69610.1 hypothetical protein HRE53_25425 [Acaryochloris sp. 'Moss Beach']